MTLILPLDAIAGSSVKGIARDMIATAKRLDIAVSMSLNGTRLLAFPTSKLMDLQLDYDAQLASGDAPATPPAALHSCTT